MPAALWIPSMTKKLSTGIPKNVLLLGVVSFLTDASSDMIYPVLPLFLSDVLRSSVLFIGLIEGIAESTASILKVFSGWFSDKLGKRKLLVALGYGLSSLGKPVLSVVAAGWQVLLVRFADRFGKGVRTSPRDALIADSATEEQRGLSYGFHRAMDSAGAVAGPLLAFVFLPLVNGNYRVLFLIASVPALLAVLILILFVKERERIREKVGGAVKFEFSRFHPKFKIFILGVTIFALGNSSDAFLLLRARDLGIGLVHVPLLWLGMHLIYALVSSPAGVLSDKIGRKNLILSGLFIYSLVYLGFAFATRPLQVWMLFGAYGFYYGLADGAMRAHVADLVEKNHRATAFGIYHGAVGLTTLPASLVFGWLWQSAGVPVAFGLGAALAFVALLIIKLGP
ncbi:MAG: MFS transporter [candidate division Zixibacteria bacterium]|nr:MFS transporter [candidate division Zixibacteria bacterium]